MAGPEINLNFIPLTTKRQESIMRETIKHAHTGPCTRSACTLDEAPWLLSYTVE